MRVEIARKARSDLRGIALFIASDNPRRALTFYEELQAACESLALHSDRYPIVRNHGHLNIRRRPYGRYLIYYCVDERKVTVLRVVHGAMSDERIFGERDQ
ncbi:type II toxin-antitoxin system RelE/ParE family toxin [Mesorhizobium xinjiangense]|uniref:type II toxin-antitoxin system RelE/ParE family toxin n=1 Tax=Mesorhizobium xinjiangense TaxID=2678685 RepID=UPI0012EE8AA1|nr:type II toxin-antitoxin system RelE/ParE family toxin [Mesorhizobium xinjiangense]